MTLNEFKKKVEEEVKLFSKDWEKASIYHGDYEFPMEMDFEEWWDHYANYDKDAPYIQNQDVDKDDNYPEPFEKHWKHWES